jgi:tRNA-dihydrouridine synthase A
MHATQYPNKFRTAGGLVREYFSIAPMVDVSDKYFRYLMRHLTKHAVLYTEMINENAVIKSQEPHRLLQYTPNQHPVVF